MPSLLRDTASAWIPPEPVRAAEWVPDNVIIPSETETPGPFDLSTFPHVTGVLEAWDDPMIRRILLPWSSRLGKTVTCLSLLCCAMATQPRPAMIGREGESAVDDLIDSQLRPLINACRPLKRELLPRQNVRSVRFRSCRIRRTYAGSPGTMAGFPACYGHASEVSKWPHSSTSKEANPIRLFQKRGYLFPFDSKYAFESTPALEGQCNITDLCDAPGVQVRYRVCPCPHCGSWQELVFGEGKEDSAGIRWDKTKTGKSDPNLAAQTAWYQCTNGCRITNADRPALLRNGRWIAEGQSIDQDGNVTGEPDCPGSETVAFGHPDRHPMGSLHALVISGWGQLAREFVEALGDSEALREFMNQTLGRTWSPKPRVIQLDVLAERLATPDPGGLCPEWCAFLTCAVDVQGEADEFHWQVCGWGPFARGHLIDYGVCITQEELAAWHRGLSYPHADGGRPLRPLVTVLDSGSGFHTESVYALCARIGAVPCKGSSKFAEFVKVVPLEEATRRRRKASAASAATRGVLYHINHDRSQRWIQSIIDGEHTADRTDRFTINADAALETHGPLLSHFTAEYHQETVDKDGNVVYVWIRTGDNEQRDLARYNRAIADLKMGHGKNLSLIHI